VLSSFQSATFFTPGTATRYANLHDRAAFIAALGVWMPIEPVPGVRGAVLDPDDVLTGEWDVAVLSPHFAAALVARDLGDRGPDNDSRFNSSSPTTEHSSPRSRAS
jgi:DICT domain-containing protein